MLMPSTTTTPQRPLAIGPIELDVPVVLAPMAGITNTAFRRLCREFGAGLYVSEMITSRGGGARPAPKQGGNTPTPSAT